VTHRDPQSHPRWWLPFATLLPLVSALLAIGCQPPSVPERSSILLITIDTLRADHLSSYGYPRDTSPILDRLAADGVRFDNAIVQWPKTAPSFASIFTATYPKDNGIVRRVGVRLPQEFRMLAEILREQGFATHAVVSNGAVASEFNFDQGFDTYIESWKLTPNAEGQDPTGAGSVTQLAQAVIDDHDPARPFFLWVHYLDPHFPYEAPEPLTDRFEGDPYFDSTQQIEIKEVPIRQMAGIGSDQVLNGRTDLAYYIARYDAEIAYVDAQIGELLDFMRERDLLAKTLTVVTSDHGESLGEHSYYFDHGRFGFQTCLRVPLIFHYPGVLEPRVDPDPVELIHLAPSILEFAGVRLDDDRWMQGRSLTPRLTGSSASGTRPAFSQAGYATERKWQQIVQDRRFKLMHVIAGDEQRWVGGKGVSTTLYDLDNDPDETIDVSDQFPDAAERLRRSLDQIWSAEPFSVLVDEGGTTEEREMDEETRRQLRALGYLQ
jgi:arylsulfatase A-like enzyme